MQWIAYSGFPQWLWTHHHLGFGCFWVPKSASVNQSAPAVACFSWRRTNSSFRARANDVSLFDLASAVVDSLDSRQATCSIWNLFCLMWATINDRVTAQTYFSVVACLSHHPPKSCIFSDFHKRSSSLAPKSWSSATLRIERSCSAWRLWKASRTGTLLVE